MKKERFIRVRVDDVTYRILLQISETLGIPIGTAARMAIYDGVEKTKDVLKLFRSEKKGGEEK